MNKQKHILCSTGKREDWNKYMNSNYYFKTNNVTYTPYIEISSLILYTAEYSRIIKSLKN